MLTNKLANPVFRPQKRVTLGKLSALSALPLLSGLQAFGEPASAPRAALVIGNAAYPRAPLRNPSNDADAIAATLKQLHFSVTLQLDCSRQQMEDAVRSFCDTVARTQSIALFYFAGHGMQINWRNYLLPVDINLTSADDISRQSVDISGLVGGLGTARSPMNIVILDACRDNPFGSTGKTGAGLSQMDAPPKTILAYATAPGNVASDGEGKNGLYTDNLLKEIVHPDAKIEEVFKRVRLSVRLRSQGRQIPWESTSLEDDFYFVPPTNTPKPTQDELDERFARDRDDWNAAQQAGTAQAIFTYLKNHPTGHFSEIAQATLDKLLAGQGEHRVTVQTSSANPYSHGNAEAGTISLGDRYAYRLIDRIASTERVFIQKVTRIDSGTIEFNDGQFVSDLLGNPRKDGDGVQYADNQIFASEYAIGKEWITRFDYVSPGGDADVVELKCRVVARETIEVPAGKFDTFRVEANGWRLYKPSRRMRSYWIAPGKVPRFIALDTINLNRNGHVVKDERRELLSFSRG